MDFPILKIASFWDISLKINSMILMYQKQNRCVIADMKGFGRSCFILLNTSSVKSSSGFIFLKFLSLWLFQSQFQSSILFWKRFFEVLLISKDIKIRPIWINLSWLNSLSLSLQTLEFYSCWQISRSTFSQRTWVVNMEIRIETGSLMLEDL